MEGTSIKAHKGSNTLIIAKNTNYAKPINYRVNLIAGTNARIMEKILIDGDLELGKGAQVDGQCQGKERHPGPLVRHPRQPDLPPATWSRWTTASVIGTVKCGGSAMIRPGVAFGSLEATGLVEVYGKKPAKNS